MEMKTDKERFMDALEQDMKKMRRGIHSVFAYGIAAGLCIGIMIGVVFL